ncbi:TPA: ead/Ea22-like family protein [Escherichia coli]|nr:ead/Ea22-like family protein [Escherichia coli]
MSEINYQALREAAERAIPAMERLLMLPADDDLLSEQELKDYGVDIDALNAFKFLAGPETVLALLDERERNQQYIKRRDQENEDIALTVAYAYKELTPEIMRNHLAVFERYGIAPNDSSTTIQALRIALDGIERSDAMLHGAEPVSQTYKLNQLSGNSPATPDGWISCSERMPNTKTAVLVAVEFDRKGDWRMKWATYIPGHPDANDGWIIPGASWKPSHWMPLPEPPQEVNQ